MQVQQHTEVLQEIRWRGGSHVYIWDKEKGNTGETFRPYSEEIPRTRCSWASDGAISCHLPNSDQKHSEGDDETAIIGRFLSQTAADESDQSLAKSEINRRLIFNYSVQPFTFISVTIFVSSELQIKCCTLYRFYSSTTFIQYSLFTSTLLLPKTK